MADSRFFATAGPFSLGELARIAGAEIGGEAGSASRVYRGVAPLDVAGAKDISFFDNKRYSDAFSASRAGACIVRPDAVTRAPAGMALLVTADPYLGYAKVASAYHPPVALRPGISVRATVDPSARLGDGCQVDAGAVIGAASEVGENCHIGPNVVIGPGVRLGNGCAIRAGASLACCLVGSRVLIHPGARIGQDGFGFATGPKGHVKVPQLGRVVIGDDVEIGANTTIDRGAGPDTIIGDGTQIDNLVQIGHNVVLGKGCVVVAQVGISGSTKVGDYVVIGGQAGFTGHLSIGNKVRIAAQSGVMRDVAEGETIGGSPATSMREWLRRVAVIDRLARKDKGT